ncbi:shikimate dehydrogenase [Actinotignum sp. GS-2025a]|uniref:shikimate dehydrogenase n=1 Tax=Actinotignum sp. GS-2025a TaxID=3427274 RepID=UPI003F4649BE
MGIDGRTVSYAVIGHPVGHSRSPAMHNASFGHLGVNAVYLAFDIAPVAGARAVTALRDLGFGGFNATMPHKTAVYESVDELSDDARLMESVNTVHIREDGSTVGHNTDGRGAFAAVRAAGYDPGDSVVILGAGGASRAIYTRAALEGVSHIRVFSRRGQNYERAIEILARLRAETGVDAQLCDLSDESALRSEVEASSLLVNATSVGMSAHPGALIPESWLHPGHIVFDAVYEPLETELLQRARRAGAGCVSGLDMLLWQGVFAEEIWLGRTDIPVEVMRAALCQ